MFVRFNFYFDCECVCLWRLVFDVVNLNFIFVEDIFLWVWLGCVFVVEWCVCYCWRELLVFRLVGFGVYIWSRCLIGGWWLGSRDLWWSVWSVRLCWFFFLWFWCCWCFLLFLMLRSCCYLLYYMVLFEFFCCLCIFVWSDFYVFYFGLYLWISCCCDW